jgi:DMSO reductase anchor subunit
MNPAYSVILFTTASGAGYGLMALLGLLGASGGTAGLALALIGLGLLASTFHLGRPERAWRALSQWRSSWLSREGVAALLTFVPALAFAATWMGLVEVPAGIAPLGLATFLFCAATVFCTGMIYASLPTIRAWAQPLTVPVYLAFALATGAALLAAIASLFGSFQPVQAEVTATGLAVTAFLKLLYWRAIDLAPRRFTIEAATGLGTLGTVRQWELPHTSINFVQKEMGYTVARRHAATLRRLVLVFLAAATTLAIAALVSPLLSVAAAVMALAAAAMERWLFFAEAQHVSTLFYGAARA